MRIISTDEHITQDIWHKWRDDMTERATRAEHSEPVFYVDSPRATYLNVEMATKHFGQPVAFDGCNIAWRVKNAMIFGEYQDGVNEKPEMFASEFEDCGKPRVDNPVVCGLWDDAVALQEQIKKILRNDVPYKQRKQRGVAYMLVSQGTENKFVPVGQLGSELIRENYAAPVLAGYDRICTSMRAGEPMGRLSILNGPPGSGKTRMVRGILEEVDECLHVLIPTKEIASLADPGMLTSLLNLQHQNGGAGKRIVLYLEDADQALAARNEESLPVISTLLQATDGMLGALLNLYVVATTNQPLSKLDEAIRRPGRLDVQMEIGALPAEQASNVFRRLCPNGIHSYDRPHTLAEIYVDAARVLRERAAS